MSFAFLLAFGVKVPICPVHTWLPDAHVEAPTGGSVVLAAITLKVGAYGFLRFILPILPDASQEYAWFVIALSLIAVAYIGLVALVQADMKKLIAYSSIAHMGFVTLGFFMFNPLGIEGGLVQMSSHGFVSAALRAKAPIVPCSIVGSEEIYPMIADVKLLARVLGVPYFPITPLFPLAGPAGFSTGELA
jgi:NADH-quinone oxidoreductase subunit M